MQFKKCYSAHNGLLAKKNGNNMQNMLLKKGFRCLTNWPFKNSTFHELLIVGLMPMVLKNQKPLNDYLSHRIQRVKNWKKLKIKTEKLLGVTFDNELIFETHINGPRKKSQ